MTIRSDVWANSEDIYSGVLMSDLNKIHIKPTSFWLFVFQ